MPFGITLLPQENRFYEILHDNAEAAYVCVQLLQRLVVEEDREKAEKLGADIHAAKTRAKSGTQEITEMLCKTFITPFDREDIHALARGLYKIPKIAQKCQERVLTFYLRPFEDDFIQLTKNMADASEHVCFLMKNLELLKVNEEMQARVTEVHNIESQTDALLSRLQQRLFEKEMDIKQLILRKDVYDMMEGLVDRHRDLSNIILEIVLKHS